jgi:dTDP-4-dehydrorhamnose reductase
MKILVLGSNGQLGRCLNDEFVNADYEVLFTAREQVDITDFEATKMAISQFSPDILINASAYTAVDKAEQEPDQANLVNHLAVGNIAHICFQEDCWLIHVSTDYVFDGNSQTPYKEDHETNPQGVYGESKVKGELVIQSSSCKHIIIRTGWVFSEYGSNFVKTMSRLGEVRDEMSIVGDQVGCPTFARDIAKTIVRILPQLDQHGVQGVYHYCGDKPSSWYDFAKAIFKVASNQGRKVPKLLNNIQSSDYPTAAKRPKYSALNCGKISAQFGVASSNWEKSLPYVLDKI